MTAEAVHVPNLGKHDDKIIQIVFWNFKGLNSAMKCLPHFEMPFTSEGGLIGTCLLVYSRNGSTIAYTTLFIVWMLDLLNATANLHLANK